MSKYTRLAETNEQEESIVEIELWLKRLNKKIIGTTTIGKSPQTIILDLTYQGSEIYIDRDGEIEFNDEKIYSYNDFKNEYDKIDFRRK